MAVLTGQLQEVPQFVEEDLGYHNLSYTVMWVQSSLIIAGFVFNCSVIQVPPCRHLMPSLASRVWNSLFNERHVQMQRKLLISLNHPMWRRLQLSKTSWQSLSVPRLRNICQKVLVQSLPSTSKAERQRLARWLIIWKSSDLVNVADAKSLIQLSCINHLPCHCVRKDSWSKVEHQTKSACLSVLKIEDLIEDLRLALKI